MMIIDCIYLACGSERLLTYLLKLHFPVFVFFLSFFIYFESKVTPGQLIDFSPNIPPSIIFGDRLASLRVKIVAGLLVGLLSNPKVMHHSWDSVAWSCTSL